MGRKRNLKLARRSEAVRPVPWRQGRSLPYAPLAVIILLLFAGGAYFYHSAREPSDREAYTAISRAVDALMPKARLPGSWFLDRLDRSAFESEIARIEKLAERLRVSLAQNLDVPEVRGLHGLFHGHLVPALVVPSEGGLNRWAWKETSTTTNPQRLEVIFYPRAAFTHPRISRRLLFYDPGLRSIFVGAFTFGDERWHSAIFIHELWHAKRHREGAASAMQTTISDLWVSEELEAHDVARKVLDARTQRRYQERLRAVVASISTRGMKRFLARITPDHMKKLDELFAPAVPDEVDIRGVQYLLDLGLLWLEGRYTGQEFARQRIKLYRYLVTPNTAFLR